MKRGHQSIKEQVFYEVMLHNPNKIIESLSEDSNLIEKTDGKVTQLLERMETIESNQQNMMDKLDLLLK